ncbi:hypothetical protein [Siphonobacter sp. SORGH_AS_1065]|uniref:hypothetical protein n=1 Tax=Siphonobacter sp. SORGH_AS_1065 TaxID=3041795 RepID=UPI0027842FCB|nr:hypothetical protein [Siphonobacter sp. SORGH_AS_1065]MDQ1088986.1 hypothetical protein [Siphonobacter sp. SORGH_AS_1065]
MKTIRLDGTAYQVPERWEECTPEQLQSLLPLRLIDVETLGAGTRAQLKWQAILTILAAPLSVTTGIDVEDRLRLVRLTNWIWKQTKIEKKPFASFTFEGVTYLLPEPHFANTSAIEIAMANIQYMAFSRKENPSTKAIYQIIATLCRPERKDLATFKASADWNGDHREEYNTVIAQERAKLFEKGNLSTGVVMCLLHYFEWMNSGFLKQYQDVYSADDDDTPPIYKNGEGLVTMLMEVAKTGTFGDFDKVCRQNGHTVWIFLRDSNLKVRRANEAAASAE